MEIAPVDQRDIYVRVLEQPGSVESAESAAYNYNAGPHAFSLDRDMRRSRVCSIVDETRLSPHVPSSEAEEGGVFFGQAHRAQRTVQEDMACLSCGHFTPAAGHLIGE